MLLKLMGIVGFYLSKRGEKTLAYYNYASLADEDIGLN